MWAECRAVGVNRTEQIHGTYMPQILQPFKPSLREPQHQGRVTRAASIAGHSELQSTAADPTRRSHVLQRPGCLRAVPGGDGVGSEPEFELQASSVSAGPSSLTSPRVLQPPRLHKRVSLPALKPGGAVGHPLLPPPSRGLPCFDTGPQVQAPSECRTPVHQSYRDLPRTQSSPEPLSLSKLREPATAKIPIPAGRSCLPKPKTS
ncbi:hypothetical protein WMY93_018647 [Mugilogobius chulae]|uniref:Uncharacterized protein n=1 Tax=Mugilogobius chulae TaxID=88201 RepID=A0AAW0NKL3_9GOBI